MDKLSPVPTPPYELTLCRAPRRVRRFPRSATHVHDFFELAFVSQGHCEWVFPPSRLRKTRNITVREGEMLLLPPDQFHHEQYAADILPRVAWVGFKVDAPTADALAELCYRVLPIPSPLNTLESILEDMMREQRECLVGWHDVISTQLSRLVLLIQRAARREGWPAAAPAPTSTVAEAANAPSPRLVASMESAAYYLRMNCHQRLSISEVSEYFHISPAYFSTVFNRIIGVTPKRFLKAARIAKARRLLEEGQLTHAHIAIECGFYDEAHFSRTFRAEVGHAPGRKSNAVSA